MFSLVDKRAGFSNPDVVGSNPGSVIFFFKYIESGLGSNIASPRPPHFFNLFNIVQYLFVHCTIPPIYGSHPHTPHHPLPTKLLPTNPLPIDLPSLEPHNPRPDLTPPPFFFNFHNNFNFSFTSTLTLPPT